MPTGGRWTYNWGVVLNPESPDGTNFQIAAKDYSGKTVGVLDYSLAKGELKVKYVVVQPAARRKGIATAMYERMMRGNPGAKLVHSQTSPEGSAFRAAFDKVHKKLMAAGDNTDISDAAKIALALQALAIVDRIIDAAADAGTDDPSTFADSLTDPTGAAVDETLASMFEGTHVTNIASIETAKLRSRLADPKFRKSHPYVMIVTRPDARFGHRVMDGYVMSAEEAQYSPLLPPYGFGCQCVPVAITADQAKAAGLIGASPVGSLEEFLAGKGVQSTDVGFTTPQGQTVSPGPAPGFSPAYGGTDTAAQLSALRAKAEEIRLEDPAAWAELQAWLLALFGYDILRKDPQETAQPAA